MRSGASNSATNQKIDPLKSKYFQYITRQAEGESPPYGAAKISFKLLILRSYPPRHPRRKRKVSHTFLHAPLVRDVPACFRRREQTAHPQQSMMKRTRPPSHRPSIEKCSCGSLRSLQPATCPLRQRSRKAARRVKACLWTFSSGTGGQPRRACTQATPARLISIKSDGWPTQPQRNSSAGPCRFNCSDLFMQDLSGSQSDEDSGQRAHCREWHWR